MIMAEQNGHALQRFVRTVLRRPLLVRVNRWFTGETSGEGGIRTLGTLLEYGALAKRCFRPLSHLTLLSQYLLWRGEKRQSGNCEGKGAGWTGQSGHLQ